MAPMAGGGVSLLLLFDEDAELLAVAGLRFTHEQLAAAHGGADTFTPSVGRRADAVRKARGAGSRLRRAGATDDTLGGAGGKGDKLA